MNIISGNGEDALETACRWGLLPDGALCNLPGHDHGPWPEQGLNGEIICGNCGIPLSNHGPAGAFCGEWRVSAPGS